MIDRDRPSALRLFFVWRGSVVAHVLPQIAGFALYAAAIVASRWATRLPRRAAPGRSIPSATAFSRSGWRR
ncbi:bestrophin family ion channel [Amaricoccus sp.]|uniref:bestrophin family ion channel n=1 Tax=Amaricoccus sp. TaxID=1872485 RepID=UPI0039E4811D